MLIDYHTHHERCGHAEGTMREYIEKAIEIGLHQLGLSDHMPVIHMAREKLLPGLGMEIHELEEYVQEAIDFKKEYKNDIDIKVGLEADYIRGYEEKIEELLSPYPFDYLIGSVHFLGEWDFSDSRQMDGWRNKSVDDIYLDYYTAIREAAESKLYDIVGHFDVIKKYGHVPKNNIEPIINQTLQVIKANDMAVEINTSGLFKVVKEVFPAPSIIKKIVEQNIPLTLGSDSHKPEQLQRGLEEGKKIIKELGIKDLATFNQRRRIMISVNP